MRKETEVARCERLERWRGDRVPSLEFDDIRWLVV